MPNSYLSKDRDTCAITPSSETTEIQLSHYRTERRFEK